MIAMNLHPPQTYSRLFRPWDSKTSDDDSNSECSFSAVKRELANASSDSSFTNVSLSNGELQQSNPQDVFPMNPIDSFGLNNTPFGPPLPNMSDIYRYPNQFSMPPPAFGMDPLSLSLMEQEYARVLTEDARLKALNSRKQRPKKFKCPHCDVAFSNNGQLKGHIRIHTGERPFKCDVESCGKTFTRNEELTRHKRIHTGLRPYACVTCAKKFGRRDHLKKHMKTHMPQERQLVPAIYMPLCPYLYGY